MIVHSLSVLFCPALRYISVNYFIFVLVLVSCSIVQGKPDHHKKLNKRELSQIFGVQNHDEGKMIVLQIFPTVVISSILIINWSLFTGTYLIKEIVKFDIHKDIFVCLFRVQSLIYPCTNVFSEATFQDALLFSLGNANNYVAHIYRKYVGLHQNNTAEFFELAWDI